MLGTKDFQDQAKGWEKQTLMMPYKLGSPEAGRMPRKPLVQGGGEPIGAEGDHEMDSETSELKPKEARLAKGRKRRSKENVSIKRK